MALVYDIGAATHTLDVRPLIASLSLALVTSIAGATAQNVAAPERFRVARHKIEAEVIAGRAASIAVAVLEHDEVVWAEGFGLANRELERPATADTIYRLASISKLFTATAIMQLVERQLVDLDAPVNRYLDVRLRAYRGTADQITVRRLLNHTGGLPTHWNFFYGGEQPPPRQESIRAYGFAAFAPGTHTEYSNFAFGVLDHVIARVSKKSYRDWIVQELCKPLGMTHTDVLVRPGQEQHVAVGYEPGDSWSPVADYGFDHDGASAVRSSANDLMRFARLHLDRGTVDGVRLLDQSSVLAMRERTGGQAHSQFGIGWSVGTERGHAVLRHSGGMPGVSTQLLVFPELHAAVAVLTNGSIRAATGRALRSVLDALLGPAEAAEPVAPAAPPPAAAAPAGLYRGLLRHPDGPIALQVELVADARANVRFAAESVQSYPVKCTATELSLRFNYELPIGHGPDDQPVLEFRLHKTPTGYAGLCYATAPAVCRLPFWCELTRAEPKPAGTLRVISYNVLVGFADSEVGRFLPGCQREAKIAAWLAAQQPDVVALQEMNGYTEARLRRLAAVWGHPHVALLKEDGYPVAITSAAPLSNLRRVREGLHHGMLRATTHGTDFIVVHYRPHAGVDKKLVESRWALGLYGRAMLDQRPAVILGDFNCIARTDVDAFSPAALERYRKWQWTLEHESPAEFALDMLLDTGAVDVLLHAGTPPAQWPLPRIDFILASPDLAARATSARWLCCDERLRWSDHPPVIADFAQSPGAANRK